MRASNADMESDPIYFRAVRGIEATQRCRWHVMNYGIGGAVSVVAS